MNLNIFRSLSLAALLAILVFSTCTPALAQQHIIANKDVTRPEAHVSQSDPALVSNLVVEKRNGYNEISFDSRQDQDVQAFVIEYSTDALNFQSAGELAVNAGVNYSYQHYLHESRPMLYRVKMLLKNNRVAYTKAYLLEGVPASPVRVYPTIVTGNTLNVDSRWPLERMTIVSGSGMQVFARDLNGQSELIPVVLPSLGKGIYFVTLIGNGWQRTERIIIS
jgi:hypothetical protein